MLTPKQKLFTEYYLISMNATDAAKQAGYAQPHTQGPRLLTHNAVKKEIQKAMDERSKKLAIDADFVLKELHSIYERVKQEVKPALNSKTGKALTDENGNALYTFNAPACLKALELMMKHVSVNAVASAKVDVGMGDDLIKRLHAGRRRSGMDKKNKEAGND